MRVTHVGGPTVLIEVGGWRLLTDPTFDPPGRRYTFGWGTSSRKLAGPAVDLPVHYEGWQHFREGRAAAERAFAASSAPVRWLEPGTPAEIEA
nr:hypothetical protein GCM10020063_025230 [Dactylosporangium thailandense]